MDASLEAEVDDVVAKVRAILPKLGPQDKHEFIKILNRELRRDRSEKDMEATFQWNVGDRVTFRGKYGINWVGTILKVNRTTLEVKARHVGDPTAIGGHMIWKVHSSNVQSGEGVE